MATIAIVGYGQQGQSAYNYWKNPNNSITICDQSTPTNVPQGVKTRFGADYLLDLSSYDLIIRGPAVHPRQILDANPEHPELLSKITTVTNEFFRVCPAPIIGVTGTKGKGTTSTLIAKILENAGFKTHLGGNIGVPPLDMLANNIQPTDLVVLELANFQLIDLHYSPPIAVCLMVSPEHLNWHSDIYEYIQAKQQMFVHQKHTDLAIYNARNLYSEEIATASHSQYRLSYDVPPTGEETVDTRGVYVDGSDIKMLGTNVCHIDDVALLGRHNLENVCAAIAATWDLVKHKKGAIKKAIKNFPGLPHRLEIIKQVNGVWYIDDSFGTTPETALVALQAFKQPKVMILGGSDKGADYSELARGLVGSNVKYVIAVGETGPKIITALARYDQKGSVGHTVLSPTNSDMSTIVQLAAQQATKGDVVLLSPASASFDMFKDYKDRGEQFKQAVAVLAQAEK